MSQKSNTFLPRGTSRTVSRQSDKGGERYRGLHWIVIGFESEEFAGGDDRISGFELEGKATVMQRRWRTASSAKTSLHLGHNKAFISIKASTQQKSRMRQQWD